MSTSASATKLYPGVYSAKVHSNSDPQQLGRVQLQIPQIFGAMPVTIWAPPLFSGATPSVGDMVWCLFQGGNPAHPTYLPHPPSGGGGGYASLTGSGETTSPGYLQQNGGLSIHDTTALGFSYIGGGGVVITDSSGTIQITETAGQIAIEGTGEVTLTSTGSYGDVTIAASGSGTTTIHLNASGIIINGNIGFYGNGPGAQPTITGSRAGNAALASLLTALDNLGLIIDSTTA